MTVITTRLTITPDSTISTTIPLPAGEHAATVTVTEPPHPRRSMCEMRRHNLPWNGSISLRRDDTSDEKGRLQ